MRDENPKDLFQMFSSHYHSHISDYKKVKNWIKKRKYSFSSALFLSVVFHTIIIGFLCFTHPSSIVSAKEKEYEVFAQAFTETKDDVVKDKSFEQQLFETEGDELLKILGGDKIFDLNLENKEKVEFYKKLIRAYFQLEKNKISKDPASDITFDDLMIFLQNLGEIELSSGSKVYVSDSTLEDKAMDFYRISKERRDQIKYFTRHEDLEKERKKIVRNHVILKTETGIRYIPSEYYFRDSPYEQILAMGARLFYVVKGFPDLEKESFLETYKSEERDVFDPVESEKKFVVFFIHDSSIKRSPLETSQSQKKLLKASNDEIQKILDDLMLLPEDEQLLYFKENYLEEYDPDDGNLPVLTKEFFYENLSNVIIIIDDISASFTYIEEIFYNRPYDRYFQSYYKENQGTKTGLEFLFCLASLYDFERRGLAYLSDSYEEAKRLLKDPYSQSDAFNIRAKAFVIKEVFEEIILEIKNRGYNSLDEVLDRYREEQKEIYSIIIRKSREARNQGLFTLGCLYWDEGQYDLAFKEWRKIDDSYPSQAFQEIREFFSNNDYSQEMISQVDDIFDLESYKRSRDLLRRLLKYHRWEKRGKNN